MKREQKEPKESNWIAFQGSLGAYSHLACKNVYPDLTPLPCESFEEAFEAVSKGQAKVGMIPIENSVAGRVADIHHLLPDSGLSIIGEHFQPVDHYLLGLQSARLYDIKTVHSHVQALSQCRKFLRKHKLTPYPEADTAGSAKELAEVKDKTRAVIASRLAGEIYGLEVLAESIADSKNNTTRFIILSRKPKVLDPEAEKAITALVFVVRSVPASLYKALGGFATNGVNITKLESYLSGDHFQVAQFYIELEGHPEQRPVALALEELRFFSSEVKMMGTFQAHPYRNR